MLSSVSLAKWIHNATCRWCAICTDDAGTLAGEYGSRVYLFDGWQGKGLWVLRDHSDFLLFYRIQNVAPFLLFPPSLSTAKEPFFLLFTFSPLPEKLCTCKTVPLNCWSNALNKTRIQYFSWNLAQIPRPLKKSDNPIWKPQTPHLFKVLWVRLT